MSVSIDNNSIYTLAAENAKTASKTDALGKKITNAGSSASDEEMMEACKSFESYMVEQMIKALEKTVPKGEEENDYKSYFGDMLYQEYAQKITDNGGLGIAQQLYESMKLNSKGL